MGKDAGTLHGIIDLLYQDQNGDWHLFDWKSEWTPRAEIEENLQQHLMQMAAYAQATQESLQAQPDVVLCFLSPGIDLYQFKDEMIANAWAEVSIYPIIEKASVNLVYQFLCRTSFQVRNNQPHNTIK